MKHTIECPSCHTVAEWDGPLDKFWCSACDFPYDSDDDLFCADEAGRQHCPNCGGSECDFESRVCLTPPS